MAGARTRRHRSGAGFPRTDRPIHVGPNPTPTKERHMLQRHIPFQTTATAYKQGLGTLVAVPLTRRCRMRLSIAVLAVVLMAFAGCGTSDSTTRSSMSSTTGDNGIELESQRLVPSASGRFCSLDGTLHNRNSSLTSLQIDHRAFNAQGREIATASIIEFNVPTNGRVAYSSSFFEPDTPCSAIARVERLSTEVIRL